MTRDEAIDTLATAFLALPAKSLRALAWHDKHGTRILCGANAFQFIDGLGGG